MWKQIALGAAVTAVGTVITPALTRMGHRFSLSLFGPDEDEDDDTMDLDELIAALEAARADKEADEEG